MLADTLIEYPHTPFGFKTITPAGMPAWKLFTESLAKAHHFTLRRDAVHLTHQIAEMRPSNFIKALPVIKLPFPVMWVWFPYADRQTWIELLQIEGHKINHLPEASNPVRLGFLLEQETPDLIRIRLAWEHTENVCDLALLHLVINTATEHPVTEANIRNVRDTENGPSRHKWGTRWEKEPKENLALAELDSRISTIPTPGFERLWAEIFTLPKASVQKIEDAAFFDVSAEWRFVMALITVINSRNIVRVERGPDLSKLNKTRSKKGKQNLIPHDEIAVHLSKIQQVRQKIYGRSGNMAMDDKLMPIDIPGHFKVRKTGIFWWSWHQRTPTHGGEAKRKYSVSL